MKRSFKHIALMALLLGCTEAVDVEIDGFESVLVVEGFLSNENRTHSISLSRTAEYSSIFNGTAGRIQMEENAIVIIRDQDGLNHTLTETAAGVYETDISFLAEAGKTYSLLIELSDGTQYMSLPETVNPVVNIDSLFYEFREIPEDEFNTRSGFDLSVSFTDPGDTSNFYLWRQEGLYEMRTFPERHVVAVPPPGFGFVPAPKDCCATCWRTERFDADINLGTDNLFDGNSLSENIFFLEDDGLRFTRGTYLVKIRQYSISRAAHDFLRLVENQVGIDGDIFDPPPAQIRGNLINLDQPDEPVIGFFWAGTVSMDSVFVNAEDLVYRQPTLEINDDCRESSGATTLRPSFWE